MPPALEPNSPSSTAAVLDEGVLVAAASSGDAAAFTCLFNQYYTAVRAFAYRLSLCRSEADDITQETFIQAAKSLKGFRGDASFKNWLYKIAANRSRDAYRKRRRRGGPEETPSDEMPAGQATSCATEEAHAAVRDALHTLNPEQREAIVLVYFEGLNHAEAARVLACAESTVSWRVFCAKRHLKKHLRALQRADRHAT